jgi:hypothetical protein
MLPLPPPLLLLLAVCCSFVNREMEGWRFVTM